MAGDRLIPEQRKRLKSFVCHLETSSLWTVVWYLRKRSNLEGKKVSNAAGIVGCYGRDTYLACDIESPSMLTSNRCAGSRSFLVLGSNGRSTLLYSASCTVFSTSNVCFRCFFSLVTQDLVSDYDLCRQTRVYAYSRLFGHKYAALRMYSGPKMNLFQRLMAFR